MGLQPKTQKIWKDFFLGAGMLWITIVLNEIIKMGWLSGTLLARCCKKFKLCNEDAKNRPFIRLVGGGNSIKLVGKVVQVRTIILVLSILIFPFVEDPSHPIWQFYLRILYTTRLLLMTKQSWEFTSSSRSDEWIWLVLRVGLLIQQLNNITNPVSQLCTMKTSAPCTNMVLLCYWTVWFVKHNHWNI